MTSVQATRQGTGVQSEGSLSAVVLTPRARELRLRARGFGRLLDGVCKRAHVLPVELCGSGKRADIVAARHALFQGMRAELPSNAAVAGVYGCDPTTVLLAMKKPPIQDSRS